MKVSPSSSGISDVSQESLLVAYSGLVHDIKQSLSLLPSHMEALKNETDLEKRCALVDRLQSICHHTLSMCDNALTGTELILKPKLRAKSVENLGTLLHEVVHSFERAARGFNVSLALHGADHLPPLACNRDGITRVMYNLVSNALRATPSGGSVEIRCTDVKDQQAVAIAVIDSGSGMSDKIKQSIGTPFPGEAAAGTRSGLGLGLYVSASIVEAHGGNLTFESEENRGTTMIVTLPLE